MSRGPSKGDDMSRKGKSNIVALAQDQSLEPEVKKTDTRTLPFALNALLVCDDTLIQTRLTAYLADVVNLHLSFNRVIPESSKQYDVVILTVRNDTNKAKTDIEHLAKMGANTILLADNMASGLVRTAMHFQVKDIVSLVELEQEMFASLCQVAEDVFSVSKVAPVYCILNGKSGSGASFITSCLGETIADISEEEIALIDADFHYGSLADSLNLTPSYFLSDALNELEQLDNVAIKSMMASQENLNLLASKPYSQLQYQGNNNLEKLSELVWKVKLNHDLILVDMSRGLEDYTLPILERADKVLIVVQQNIVSLREAKALVQQLGTILGLDPNIIHIIVNRYSTKASHISLAEIEKALGVNSVFSVNNNYQLASSCTDLGSPLLKLSDNKSIHRDITRIVDQLFPVTVEESETGFFSRWFKKGK